MKVTDLIEDLQEIADLDPTTEILVSVAGAERYRTVERVEHVDSSTLTRPVATIECSPGFVDPEQAG